MKAEGTLALGKRGQGDAVRGRRGEKANS